MRAHSLRQCIERSCAPRASAGAHERYSAEVIRVLAAVFAGGVVGTAGRVGIDLLLPTEPGAFALSTLIVNVLGSLLLGAAVSAFWPRLSVVQRAAVGPGLLGAFTTFSAVAASVVHSEPLLAAATVIGTALLAFAAAAIGLRLGTRISARAVRADRGMP